MLKQQIQSDMKSAMKSGDKKRLGVIRLILAAVKQREVDERTELGDDQILAVLDKMVKQRRDSMDQYNQAGRTELAQQEAYEVEICQAYMPEALTDEEIERLLDQALTETGATSVKDMGRLMGWLKPKVQGRADMGSVSARVRHRLNT